MLLRRWMLVPTLAASLALPLAGCTPETPKPTTTGSASATPLFSSDEEALAVATKAYAAYLKMSDTISHDGGANPERIKKYVTSDVYSSLKSDFAELEASGHYTSGATRARDIRLRQRTGLSVSTYLCSDVSGMHVMDRNGVDVTPASRQEVLPLVVEFTASERSLVVSESSVWAGKDFC